ncbi:MAG: 4'-phosphopantetheinyl transferase superfamily protein [Myxococcota bacterium]|nr:4'-phosphopantetheinyl transferase superfamily protein [Myxococcota bacterium]
MELAPGHVLVRTAAPDVLGPRALAHGWLTLDEERRAERIRHARGRHAFAAARGLLRSLLAEGLGGEPAAIPLSVEESGRPFLDGDGDVRISVTHTEGLVACAVGRVSALGVDAERQDRRPRSLALARRYFAPAEVRALESLPEDGVHRHFLALWTCKEALGKALGQGVGPVLGNPVFALGPGDRVEGGAPEYRHELHALASGHWLAIAARGAQSVVLAAFEGASAEPSSDRSAGG